MNRTVIVATLATLLAGCANTPTVASNEPSLRGTITGVARQSADGTAPDSLSPVQTVVVRPIQSGQAGSFGRCYRDAVLTVSRSTRIRRSTGETVGAHALLVGQRVSVWTQATFPMTSICQPGLIAAEITIEAEPGP